MRIIDLINEQKKAFCSVEFFPPKDRGQWDTFFNTVETLKEINPLFASVTYGAGGSSQDATLEISSRIKKNGLEPMPHFTCVGASKEKIEDFLDTVKKEKIDNILALRGDPPKDRNINWDEEPFKHAEELIHFIKEYNPDLGISAAVYPAPHPESKTFALDQHYTRSKALAGTQVFISQLFFDIREYTNLVNALQAYNINIPVIPGILPIQSLNSIKRTLTMCGANLPAQLYFALEEAHKEGGDEAVKELGTEYAIKQIKELLNAGAKGIHLYTLNKADLCLKIAKNCF